MDTKSSSSKKGQADTKVSLIEEADLVRAVAELKAGGLVAFPTETVYGLGADASNPEAVLKIFAAKGRPPDHPLIVHIADASDLPAWSTTIPEIAYQLAKAFWPGPLTLILPGSKAPREVTGGQDSIGLRAPRHPVAQALIRKFGGGIAAPSANRFGRISPTEAAHVREELGHRIDLILEGGECEVGLESTILSLVGPYPCLLRPGAISQSQLEAVLGQKIQGVEHSKGIRASGLLESHYAPRTPLRLSQKDGFSTLIQGAKGRVALMALSPHEPEGLETVVAMPMVATEYGHRLYAQLRALDSGDFSLILAEIPPHEEAWTAVHDRLQRASHESRTTSSDYPTGPEPTL
jgi:L-threonylcarbamoyladenylate synthase